VQYFTPAAGGCRDFDTRCRMPEALTGILRKVKPGMSISANE
jgi:hypothetical protein